MRDRLKEIARHCKRINGKYCSGECEYWLNDEDGCKWRHLYNLKYAPSEYYDNIEELKAEIIRNRLSQL